jgi:hypothetical protein
LTITYSGIAALADTADFVSRSCCNESPDTSKTSDAVVGWLVSDRAYAGAKAFGCE